MRTDVDADAYRRFIGRYAEPPADRFVTVETETALEAAVRFGSFADWWTPYTLGVGPAGAPVASLDDTGREHLRDACAARVPDAPFDVTAAAWTVPARA